MDCYVPDRELRFGGVAGMISRSEYLALLRMLIKRATFIDRWRAKRICGHWLNVARREVSIG